MLLAVPLRVEGGVLEPEVGRQVDDAAHPLAQSGDELLGLAVGQGAEDQVEAIERGHVGVLVDQAGVGGPQRWRVPADGLPGVGMGGGHPHLEGRMGAEQA